MGVYKSNGKLASTTVTGSSLVGLKAADGSFNIVLDDAAHTGVYHPSGALRVNSSNSPKGFNQDASGAHYIDRILGHNS